MNLFNNLKGIWYCWGLNVVKLLEWWAEMIIQSCISFRVSRELLTVFGVYDVIRTML